VRYQPDQTKPNQIKFYPFDEHEEGEEKGEEEEERNTREENKQNNKKQGNKTKLSNRIPRSQNL
jgi:hypothetical protein